jgi:alkanesulfonate monooxygenase SsuD/methylene tetrahydromethanopterin reductase-like flavin-dependent oxidoreductase (luciferase family)
MPLRRPWKVASESVALDHLSEGRLILGLGTGAVWMGWQAFPDYATDTRTRAELLHESIDILSLLYRGKAFDYDGKHYHLRLTAMDEQHYPPPPVQQPRIPLWVVEIALLNGLLGMCAAYGFKKYGFLAAVGTHFWTSIV